MIEVSLILNSAVSPSLYLVYSILALKPKLSVKPNSTAAPNKNPSPLSSRESRLLPLRLSKLLSPLVPPIPINPQIMALFSGLTNNHLSGLLYLPGILHSSELIRCLILGYQHWLMLYLIHRLI